MPTPAAALRSLLTTLRAWRLPEGALAGAVAGVLGLGVLGSLSALHAFEPRVTPAPELPPSPSPWLVDRAEASDDGACQLSLLVRDGDAGVDNAAVEVVRLQDGAVVARRFARTDHKGTIRLIDLPPGYYDVTVDVPERALNGAPTFRCDPSAGGRRAFHTIDVAAADGLVEGHLLGHQEKPLALASVALWQQDGDRAGLSGVVRVRTDKDGAFSARLPRGRYVAFASAADHVSKKLTLTVGEKTVVRLVLPFSPAVRGVVVDELGAPIPGAVVAVGGAFDPRAKTATVRTDEAGRFSLPVQAGQDVTVTARGNGRVARAILGVVDDLHRFQQIQLVATAGRTVSGTVYTTSGTPLAFGAVHYRVKLLGLEGEAPTDGEGRFILDGMPADADVEVWAAGHAAGAWGAQVATPERNQLALTYVAAAW